MSENVPLRNLRDMPPICTSCEICPAQGCELRVRAFDSKQISINRRRLLAGSAGVVLLNAIGGAASAQEATISTPAASAEACIALTPEMTEGPYYIDDLLLRDDITEGREGIPLELTVHVINTVACEPLADAAVDIWHCDALGDYSGIGGVMGNDDTSGQTWLRGVQLTGQSGSATINTIYPGWYVGRATHIHIKVHTGGSAEDGTYLGGETAHTGQIFFDDAITDQVAQLEPYVQRIDTPRTQNEEDGILNGSNIDASAFFVTLKPLDEKDLSLGFTGTALLGVDPSAVGAETGVESNGGMQPPTDDGPPPDARGGFDDAPEPPGGG